LFSSAKFTSSFLLKGLGKFIFSPFLLTFRTFC
jgi:hypothetical protein